MPREKLPEGSFIAIEPVEDAANLSFKEERTSKNGLKTSFYSLQDNSRAYLVDSRDTKTGAGVVLSVPVISQSELLYGGGKITSLQIHNSAAKGSPDEKDFYKFIDSFKWIDKP